MAYVSVEAGRVGLTEERVAHARTLLFPIAAAVRLAKKVLSKTISDAKLDLKPLPSSVNRGLAHVLFVERWLLQSVDLPFGPSVICVSRK